MSQLTIKHTGVFKKNFEALKNEKVRFIINQGGTRSSKTYSLCQLVIVYCLRNENKVVSIVRKSFPALRGSVMRDFLDIMNELGIYKETQHNKSENIYTFDNGSRIEFFSVDDAQKVRGRRRDVLWANEANELSFEDYNQLNFRTTEKLFFDFNPSETEHWLYDLLDKEDSIKIHSTYKDNSFLPLSLIKEIEDLINTDEDYYNVYALGLPSKSTSTIYNHQKPYINELVKTDETVLGLDFGYQHPTALIKCDFSDDMAFVKELIYESYLTGDELVDRMNKIFKEQNISKSTIIVADYSRPEMIEVLNRNGFNVINADKSVKEGIDAVKSTRLFYHNDSINLKKEFKNYKWKMAGERVLDEPIKLHDDGMDAMRYAILYYKKNKRSAGGWDFMII